MGSPKRLLSALQTANRGFIGGFRTKKSNPETVNWHDKPHQGKKEMERRAKKLAK